MAQNTDAMVQAAKTLGIEADRFSESVLYSTEELVDAAGNNTGIFVEFTPTLPDGTVISAETWQAYLNKITNGGTITSSEAILAADRQGAEIDGQQI